MWFKEDDSMVHQRKEYRLKHYDYSSPNSYFITICIKNRQPILWQNVLHQDNGDVGAPIGRPVTYTLSPYGNVVDTAINNIPRIYPNVNVDKYVVMPNHIHLILTIRDKSENHSADIANIVNKMKGYVSRQIGFSPWQKLYYDRIIRDEEEYNNKIRYIEENPAKWTEDDEYINLQCYKNG